MHVPPVTTTPIDTVGKTAYNEEKSGKGGTCRMMISTKGRYALRVMVDLAEHRQEGYIPLRTVALRQGISQKYLESIMTTLSKAGFVDGTHGRGGGYRLVRPPEDYPIGPLLRAIEGPLAPVQCVEEEAVSCGMADTCRTRALWQGLDQVIRDYLDNVTLAQLMVEEKGESD